MSVLFSNNIRPMCLYCEYSKALDESFASCPKKGVVALNFKCRKFKYDPLKRIPARHAAIRGHFSDSDFKLT